VNGDQFRANYDRIFRNKGLSNQSRAEESKSSNPHFKPFSEVIEMLEGDGSTEEIKKAIGVK